MVLTGCSPGQSKENCHEKSGFDFSFGNHGSRKHHCLGAKQGQGLVAPVQRTEFRWIGGRPTSCSLWSGSKCALENSCRTWLVFAHSLGRTDFPNGVR